MDKKRLLDLAEKARRALRELEDEVMIQVTVGWKPLYGLVQGCIEQVEDIKDNIADM